MGKRGPMKVLQALSDTQGDMRMKPYYQDSRRRE